MSISQRIKYYRDQAGLSQEKLASLVFLSERTIGHYETGKRNPPVDKLELIADALEVELSDLVQTSNKDENEWYDFLLNTGKQSRKNMDEKRFRIIASRCFYGSSLQENANEISCNGYIYNKCLATKLLKLTKNNINISEIWYLDFECYWKICGFVDRKFFEIKILIEDDKKEVCVNSVPPKTPKGEFYIEYREILLAAIEWFTNQFKDYTFVFNVFSFLHLPGTTKEMVQNFPIKSGNFSSRVEKVLLNHEKYNTVAKLLNISKSEWHSIPHFEHAYIFEVQKFLNQINAWLNDQTFISALDPSLTRNITDPLSIRIEDTFLNIRIVNALKREGYNTLIEVCQLTRSHAYAIYGIDKKELKELEKELESYGLKFSSESSQNEN